MYFVIDFADVTHVDSAYIYVVGRVLARLKMGVGNFVLSRATTAWKSILHESGLNRFFPVYDTLEAAVSSLHGIPEKDVSSIEYPLE